MTYHIVTLFPKLYEGFLNTSLIKKSVDSQKLKFNLYNLREWGLGKRKTLDGKPFGGGPGMILRIEPIVSCVNDIKKNISQKSKLKTIIFSANGEKYNQKTASLYANFDELILICPRYEGYDARIPKLIEACEISIGDYILMSGDIPAMTIIESVSRLISGVLGKKESLIEESFNETTYSEYPQYTLPRKYKNIEVPEILISGNHQKIAQWKVENSKLT